MGTGAASRHGGTLHGPGLRIWLCRQGGDRPRLCAALRPSGAGRVGASGGWWILPLSRSRGTMARPRSGPANRTQARSLTAPARSPRRVDGGNRVADPACRGASRWEMVPGGSQARAAQGAGHGSRRGHAARPLGGAPGALRARTSGRCGTGAPARSGAPADACGGSRECRRRGLHARRMARHVARLSGGGV